MGHSQSTDLEHVFVSQASAGTCVRGWFRLIVVQSLLNAYAVVTESILLAFLTCNRLTELPTSDFLNGVVFRAKPAL